MVTRHQFLSMLHDLLKPQFYLEIGVQYGLSLDLAGPATLAVGVDPAPQVAAKDNQIIHQMTSQEFFEKGFVYPTIDLGFIDGSHLWEDALADFLNMARMCHAQSVIVFDDVLPYNQEMTSREMIPGDWTGDVWKAAGMVEILAGLKTEWVNTFPTGTMAVWGFGGESRESIQHVRENYEAIVGPWTDPEVVPDHILKRTHALEAEAVIEMIREDLCASQ